MSINQFLAEEARTDVNDEFAARIAIKSPNSLRGMFIAAREAIYESFVSKDRQAMRNALKFWCAAGCFMRVPHDSPFPMTDFKLTKHLPDKP